MKMDSPKWSRELLELPTVSRFVVLLDQRSRPGPLLRPSQQAVAVEQRLEVRRKRRTRTGWQEVDWDVHAVNDRNIWNFRDVWDAWICLRFTGVVVLKSTFRLCRCAWHVSMNMINTRIYKHAHMNYNVHSLSKPRSLVPKNSRSGWLRRSFLELNLFPIRYLGFRAWHLPWHLPRFVLLRSRLMICVFPQCSGVSKKNNSLRGSTPKMLDGDDGETWWNPLILSHIHQQCMVLQRLSDQFPANCCMSHLSGGWYKFRWSWFYTGLEYAFVWFRDGWPRGGLLRLILSKLCLFVSGSSVPFWKGRVFAALETGNRSTKSSILMVEEKKSRFFHT